ncbi:PTS sugar transporter subunit IIA [Anaerococcus lactolyticus]|uniref:PTS sugar transporter subunit IIA n=1 Tax=Anaerococcus lactolyticus TaxID=33032 RepID=UPI0023F5259C|nr:PTS fructose transporter subunit IIBC [Anaerococcus lactolyticus]
MANAVIAVSHASLASGVYSAIKMIAGEFDNVRVEEFKDNDSLEAFDQKLLIDYEELTKNYKNIFILADLAGGTPFNRSVMTLGDRENVRVIGGLNFASLYTAINSDYDDIDAGVEDIIQTAKESLVVFETKKEEADDFEEDGI